MRISLAIRALAAGALLMSSGLIGASASAAGGHTIYVAKHNCSNSGPGSLSKPFCTIQEGVDAASPGDGVVVSSGTYVEQVLIGSGKKNVSVTGDGNNTIIQAPASMSSTKTIVEVTGATGVTVQQFTITGPGSGGCDSLEYGVKVDGGGQATIQNNHITKIEDSPFSGCQNGVAILVGHASESTTGSAVISGNKIDNYQKGGVVVSNTGSSASIWNNTITGAGPTAVIAQNGLQISAGATAPVVTNNTIKGNVYSPQSVSSTGVLLFDAGVVNLSNNNINSNDVGLYLYGTGGSTFNSNVTNGSTFNGIYVDLTSTGNTFNNNSARGTGTAIGDFDMQDVSIGSGTAHTANLWQDNTCKTGSPKGICSHS